MDFKPLVANLLTSNGKGWKVELFLGNEKYTYTCAACNNICNKAVSLDCDLSAEEDNDNDNEVEVDVDEDDDYNEQSGHLIEELELYCEICLKQLIQQNKNLCPISDHSNPKYNANGFIRRRIMEAKVVCPNSVQYKQIQAQVKDDKFNKVNNHNSDDIDIDNDHISSRPLPNANANAYNCNTNLSDSQFTIPCFFLLFVYSESVV
jgi:hypothetical protein